MALGFEADPVELKPITPNINNLIVDPVPDTDKAESLVTIIMEKVLIGKIK